MQINNSIIKLVDNKIVMESWFVHYLYFFHSLQLNNHIPKMFEFLINCLVEFVFPNS